MALAESTAADTSSARRAGAASRRAPRRHDGARARRPIVVPRADEHQNEYVAPSEERLQLRSAASPAAPVSAAIGRNRARRSSSTAATCLQVRQQSDAAFWEHRHVSDTPFVDWAKSRLSVGRPRQVRSAAHTSGEIKRWRTALRDAGIDVVPIAENLVDRGSGRSSSAAARDRSSLHPVEHLAGRRRTSKRIDASPRSCRRPGSTRS